MLKFVKHKYVIKHTFAFTAKNVGFIGWIGMKIRRRVGLLSDTPPALLDQSFQVQLWYWKVA